MTFNHVVKYIAPRGPRKLFFCVLEYLRLAGRNPRWPFDRFSQRRHNIAVIIESIDRQNSSELELACRTAPPIDHLVFQQFCVLLKAAGKSDIARFREQDGMLFIRGASWSARLRDTLDTFLTNAENTSLQARQLLAEKTRLERHKKDRAVEAAAKALGVPVK
jgi:hypothetical protein